MRGNVHGHSRQASHVTTGRKIYNSYCNYVHTWKNNLFRNTVWQHFVETIQFSKWDILCSITVLWPTREIYTGLKSRIFSNCKAGCGFKKHFRLISILRVRVSVSRYAQFTVLHLLLVMQVVCIAPRLEIHSFRFLSMDLKDLVLPSHINNHPHLDAKHVISLWRVIRVRQQAHF